MIKGSELPTILDDLIGRWCDRRALNPLRYLLNAYPLHMGTSDEWQELWAALRNVRGLSAADLQDAERHRVDEALRLVDRAIREAGQVPTGPSA
jgi:hypothetical protein